MLEGLQLLVRRLDRAARQREVEEELQLHIDMQAGDYEREGLTPEESLAQAKLRFGDYDSVKDQCLQIGRQNSVGLWLQKALFIAAFILGVLIRTLDAEVPVTRMGDVLIMIAVFGGLLVTGKSIRTSHLGRSTPPLRLGLRSDSSSIPPAFDEAGRTPFERVRRDL